MAFLLPGCGIQGLGCFIFSLILLPPSSSPVWSCWILVCYCFCFLFLFCFCLLHALEDRPALELIGSVEQSKLHRVQPCQPPGRLKAERAAEVRTAKLFSKSQTTPRMSTCFLTTTHCGVEDPGASPHLNKFVLLLQVWLVYAFY